MFIRLKEPWLLLPKILLHTQCVLWFDINLTTLLMWCFLLFDHISSYVTKKILNCAPTYIRKLKQRRRRRQGWRLRRSEFIFYKRNSWMPRSVRFTDGSKSFYRLNTQRRRRVPKANSKNYQSSFTFRRRRRTWSFHVVVLQRTAKKCTKT